MKSIKQPTKVSLLDLLARLTVPKRLKQDAANKDVGISVHIVIAHTEPHKRWAERLQTQIPSQLQLVFPNMGVEVKTLQMPSEVSRTEATKILSDYENTITHYGSADTPSYSFIVTPGWRETETVCYMQADNLLRSMAHLFCVPGSPAEVFGLSTRKSKNCGFFGVYNHPAKPESYLRNIRAIKGGAKRVCLAYNDTLASPYLLSLVRCQVDGLESAFEEAGIKLIKHPWSLTNMNADLLKQKMETCDVLITLNEPTAELFYRETTKLCMSLNKPYIPSELDSVAAGAVLGVGVFGGSYAAPLASLITKHIMSPGTRLRTEVIGIPEQSGAHLNPHACESQGVKLTEEQETFFKMKNVFGNHPTEY